MKKNLKIIAIISSTFVVLFATTFLLDLPLVYESTARKILVWVLLAFQLLIGILLLKAEIEA